MRLSCRDSPKGSELTRLVAVLPKVVRFVPEYYVTVLKEGSSLELTFFSVYFR